MEVRELEYFVAVAEELHIGRAAERLGIAQPPLSRAVQQLERRLGVALLERSSRGVSLTPAGAVLLREAPAALDAVLAAERRTQRAGGSGRDSRLVLVTKAGAAVELVAKLVDAYAVEPEAVSIDVLLCGPGEQERLLRDGSADVALLHRPFDSTAGLDTEELGTEGQVAVLPGGHAFASRRQLTLADLDQTGLPLPRWPAADGSGCDAAGSGDGGPQVHSHEQLFQLIALGRAMAVLPDSVQAQLRGGFAVIPVVDAPRVTTVIAWPPQSTSRALAALVRVATRL